MQSRLIASSNLPWSHINQMLCVGSAIGLLIVWVLPNTIALRHVFLVGGFISALFVIKSNSFFKNRLSRELLPIYALLGLFLWAVIHLIWFSLNPILEWQELRSIWLRAFLALVIAIGVRIAIEKSKWLRIYFYIALFAVSLINLTAYFYLSLLEGKFLLPVDFVWKFTFKKIEAAMYGVLAIAIACANLFYLISRSDGENKRSSTVAIIAWISGIVLALASSLVANTKNGIAGGVGLCVLLGGTLVLRGFLDRGGQKKKRTLLAALIVLILMLAVWSVHQRFASQGWDTLIEDIQYSAKVDEHDYWRKHDQTGFLPNNSAGKKIAGNTYERVAWAVVGIDLIKQYPFGYGSVNRSFVGMLNHAKIEHQLHSQTHSGWIDFGLGYGIPGLILLGSAFGLILWRGFLDPNRISLMGIWLVLGLLPFGLIAEITYKHNFEALIFFIAFASATVMRIDRQFVEKTK